jgi:hypothetical protein
VIRDWWFVIPASNRKSQIANHKFRWRVARPALLVAMLSIQLGAQDVSPVAAGARLRVRTSDGRTLIGRVEDFTPANLTLHPDGQVATITLPRPTLTRVDVSRGPRTRTKAAWAGARKGALIGGIPGAVLLALQHDQIQDGVGIPHAAALGAWSGGLFGGLIGAIVSARRPGEQWERVPIY